MNCTIKSGHGNEGLFYDIIYLVFVKEGVSYESRYQKYLHEYIK